MNKFLFASLFIPSISFGQNFDFDLNGGINFHSLPIANNIAKQDKAVLGYAASAHATLFLPHTQLGVGVEAVSIDETNYLAPNYTVRIHNHVANPLIAPHAFYNLVFNNPLGFTYLGAMGGPSIAKVGVNTYDMSGNYLTNVQTHYFNAVGFTAGLQVGAAFNVSKRIAINAQTAIRFTSFDYKPEVSTGQDQYKYRLFYFPTTVGLRYKI